MIIGLTYDLRSDYLAEGYTEEETAEFDRPDTIEAIESALSELGHTPQRIGNIKNLVTDLAHGKRWDLVFNIAEGMHGFGREAQVPALLDAYRIPYTFSDPLTLAVTLHKAMTKSIVRDRGIPTADFTVVTGEDDLRDVAIPYPLFVKPVAEGTGKGVDSRSRVESFAELQHQCALVIRRYRQPALVERFLPGREFTVGIIGTHARSRVIGVLEIILRADAQPDAYSYINKEKCEDLVTYRLVNDEMAQRAALTALCAWRVLGCRDAGRVDLRADAAGVPHFVEVNPLAGLHPQHSDLPILCSQAGMPYNELIRCIIEEASSRIAADLHPVHKIA